MDGEKKRLLLDGEIAGADLMRFEWIDTVAKPHEIESAREEICHVEEMEQISQVLD